MGMLQFAIMFVLLSSTYPTALFNPMHEQSLYKFENDIGYDKGRRNLLSQVANQRVRLRKVLVKGGKKQM